MLLMGLAGVARALHPRIAWLRLPGRSHAGAAPEAVAGLPWSSLRFIATLLP